MAKARSISAVRPGATFREAAAAVVEVRTEELFSFAGGVLDTGDIERVHDMRVASRRLRAAMEVFGPCFPKAEFKRALRDVKDLADDLGRRRDPDVAIEALERAAAGLATGDRPGVRHLITELADRQRSGNAALADTLERIEAEQLKSRLLGLAAAARSG